MTDLQTINPTDEIRNTPDKHNINTDELNRKITNTTTGHKHNGSDSRSVDHTDLLNKGTNTHAQIDSALSNASSHSGDSSIHVTTNDKSNWNGSKTEVENARKSAAKGVDYETLDARLEAIETSSTPEAHGNLSGRDTEATSSDAEDHAHTAEAIWDATGNQNLQDGLDDKLDTSDLKTAINNLTDNDIDGAKIETATDTAKGTVLLGATGGAATYDHDHDFSDTAIESSHYHAFMGEVLPTKLYVHDRINAINQGCILKNEVFNGVFTFAGYDGSNNVHTLGQATASATKKYGIPGWHVGADSYTGFLAKVEISDVGTPTWGDFENVTLRHRGQHGNAILELSSSDWTATQSNVLYSNVMCVDADKDYTFIYWYRHPTATTANHLYFWLEYWSGSEWTTINTNMTLPRGGDNDTNWHQVIHTGSLTNLASADVLFVRIKYTFTGHANAQDIQIARVGCFEGIWESAEHILPEAWYNHHIDKDTSINTTTGTNSFPTSLNTWVDWLAYKKTYITSATISSAFAGSYPVVIPDCHYIYNIKVTPSYLPTTTVPTTPPVAVPVWYSYWQQANGQDFNAILSSINVYFPAPNSGSGTVTIEVDYWPADIPDGDLP